MANPVASAKLVPAKGAQPFALRCLQRILQGILKPDFVIYINIDRDINHAHMHACMHVGIFRLYDHLSML